MCLSAVTSLDHGFWLSVPYKRHFEEVINGSSRIKAALHILFRVHCACYVDDDSRSHTTVFYYLSVYWSHQSQYHCIQRAYLLLQHLSSVVLYTAFRITEHLGSGQFGTVNKGIWQSPAGAVEVAVKTLQSSASQGDRVKFLQEAAINGQFRHPNVVKLLGVITVGEPVSNHRSVCLYMRGNPG